MKHSLTCMYRISAEQTMEESMPGMNRQLDRARKNKHQMSNFARFFMVTAMAVALVLSTGNRYANAQTPSRFKAVPAVACAIETDWAEDYGVGTAGAIRNLSDGIGARFRRLHCPIPSDTVFRQEDIASIEVYFDDRNPGNLSNPNSQLRVYVCSQSLWDPVTSFVPSPGSGSCSLAVVNASVKRDAIVLGPGSSAISRLLTHTGGYFSELVIEIPQAYYGNASSVLGYAIRFW